MLARLVTRAQYYELRATRGVDVGILAAMCSRHWRTIWQVGDRSAGDEMIVPHRGRRAGQICQFVPRKPHNTGIKLYVLSDHHSWYASLTTPHKRKDCT